MTVYIINILLCFVVCEMARNKVTVNGDLHRTNKKPVLFFILALWVCLYAFRYKVGADSWAYNDSFRHFVANDYSFSDMFTLRRDWMFSVTEFVSTKVLGFNRVGLYAVLGFFTYAPVLLTIEDLDKNSKDFDLTFIIMLYIGTMSFYGGFNGTRQGIATAFIMLAYYKYLRKKKYVGYAVVMIVAFGFHSATLFTIPFHLLSLKKLNSALVKTSIFSLLASCVFLPQIWNRVVELLEALGQTKMANDYNVINFKGASIFRILVTLMPIVVSLVFYDRIKENDPGFEPDLILTIFSAVFMLFSARSAIFARLAAIIGVSNIFTIARICRIDRSQRLMKIVIVVLFFLYMTMLLLAGDGHYYPYQFIPSLDATW